jgi:hypothetical protein
MVGIINNKKRLLPNPTKAIKTELTNDNYSMQLANPTASITRGFRIKHGLTADLDTRPSQRQELTILSIKNESPTPITCFIIS